MKPSILIIEDEKHMVVTLSTLLGADYDVAAALSGEEGVKIAKLTPVDVILLDLKLPGMSGIEVLKRVRSTEPAPEVIVITAVREVKTAVEAMKLGAFDYIEKPFDSEELLMTISKALERQHLSREVGGLRAEVASAYGIDSLIGTSTSMQEVLRFIERVRELDSNVLILGESGTGKELVARAIHYTGQRKYSPFVAINCACLPENMLESELFGHERGAFTGAEKRRRGKIELAHTGTLFLDEIGSMSLAMQAKVLRVIELKEFERLGGETTVRSDFRVIAASNINLEEAVKAQKFREDLYYRLNVASIHIAPLRERRSDIPLLLNHFLECYYHKTGRFSKGFTDEAMNYLISYDWPGNVRQLQNVIEMALIMEDGIIASSKYFPDAIVSNNSSDEDVYTVRAKRTAPLGEATGVFESMLIRKALDKCSWDRQKAADLLNVHLNTLKNKIAKYGISKPS